MPEQDRNSEIRSKLKQITLESGKTEVDMDTLKSHFPDFFSGESYRQTLRNEVKAVSLEASAAFAGYPKHDAFNKLRALIALKTSDIDLELLPVLDFEVSVNSSVSGESEDADQTLKEVKLKRKLKNDAYIFGCLHPFLVSVESFMALGKVLNGIFKDIDSLDKDLSLLEEHLKFFSDKLRSLKEELEALKPLGESHHSARLNTERSRTQERLDQTNENKERKNKRKMELENLVTAVTEGLVLCLTHHHRTGGLGDQTLQSFLEKTTPVYSTPQRLDALKKSLSEESVRINLPARFLPLTEKEGEMAFIAHDSDKEAKLIVEREIERRRKSYALWAKRTLIGGALVGAGIFGISRTDREVSEKPAAGLAPTPGTIKVPKLKTGSEFGIRERINADGSKTVTLPAPEIKDQFEFVRRNVLGYLKHEGFLDEKLERDIMQADDFLLLEGTVMGHFTDTWLVPADNPTFHHLSLTVHPQIKRLIQVMYGREAEVKVYTDNSTRENDRGVAIDVSLNKNLLCSDAYKIGLYVKPHAEANGQAHLMHAAVKKRLFCK